MSLSALTALPRRLATTTVGAATHPVTTIARGVGFARGTATGLVHAVRGSTDAPTATPTATPGTGTSTGAPTPAAAAPSTVPQPAPPAPTATPTPDPERTAPGSVVKPEPEPGHQHTPEPEPELVYSTSTPEGAEPGAGPDAGSDSGTGLLDPGTARALASEADTMSKAADPRFGD